MEKLIGKIIHKILIDSEDEILVFVTNTGNFVFQTYGDCCSSTWFDSITGVEALLAETVLTVESIDNVDVSSARDEIEGHYIEEMQNYGVKITTQKGYVDIVYRNSSNGYYGGDYEPISEIPDLSNYIEITQDWEA